VENFLHILAVGFDEIIETIIKYSAGMKCFRKNWKKLVTYVS